MSQAQQFLRCEVVRGKSTLCFPAGEWHCKAPLPQEGQEKLPLFQQKSIKPGEAAPDFQQAAALSLACTGLQELGVPWVTSLPGQENSPEQLCSAPLWAPAPGEQLWKWQQEILGTGAGHTSFSTEQGSQHCWVSLMIIKLSLTKKGFTGYRGWMDKTRQQLCCPEKKERVLYLSFNERERK